MHDPAQSTLQSDTPFHKRLSGRGVRPTALDAFKLARRLFIGGQRIDMKGIAAELGIDRTTLYRWVGNRDQLLGEVLWSLTEQSVRIAEAETTVAGVQRITEFLDRMAAMAIQASYFQRFLNREPEVALRVITTKKSIVQRRFVGELQRMLEEEQERANLVLPLPAHDCAYLLTRIMESFFYAELITGEEPDHGKGIDAVRIILSQSTS